jgi:hypothetical protein
MSVSVMIGEALPCEAIDAGSRFEVQEERIEGAPNFPGQHQAGHNLISMGTTGFAALCQSRTVADLMGAQVSTGALPPDGGKVTALTEAHLRQAQTAVRCSVNHGEPGFIEGHDATLARLLLLEFWIGWALRSCKSPVMLTY